MNVAGVNECAEINPILGSMGMMNYTLTYIAVEGSAKSRITVTCVTQIAQVARRH